MEVLDLGLINYSEAHKIQTELVEKVIKTQEQETIILCSHHPIVTLGKKSCRKDLGDWSGEVYETKRGGQITYHGPGQIIAYPILNLKHRSNDIYAYLRALEISIVETLKNFKLISNGDPNNTGVWIEKRKVASIGVAIKKWVTYHGLAVNIENDPLAFKGINPCGMNSTIMTNLENELSLLRNQYDAESSKKYLKTSFKEKLTKNLLKSLKMDNF